MTLATRGNAIILKDGKLAQSCECCGWYCYAPNSCECFRAFLESLTAGDAASLVPVDSLASEPWRYQYNYTFPITNPSVDLISDYRDPTTLAVKYRHSMVYNGVSPCSGQFQGYPLVTQSYTPAPRRAIGVNVYASMYVELLPTPMNFAPTFTNWDAITAFRFGTYSYSGPPFALDSLATETLRRVYSASYAAEIGYAGPNIVADEDFNGTVSVSGHLQNNAGAVAAGTPWSLDVAFHPLIYGA